MPHHDLEASEPLLPSHSAPSKPPAYRTSSTDGPIPAPPPAPPPALADPAAPAPSSLAAPATSEQQTIKVEGHSDLFDSISDNWFMLIALAMFALFWLMDFATESKAAMKGAAEVPEVLREILGELQLLRKAIEAQG